ncbi:MULTISPECIES: hypothetical protein [unclassified Methylobacterium]|uniref:hypothetical protein n=1 Tax=unclassified Methylobacterium TaxID=2615210 RepID=UPI000B1B0F47|nr:MULTISPECIES: hypothetical protein [unclassified Methylobacterium]
MTQPSTRPSETGLGRLIKALDSASEALVKGLDRMLGGAVATPQPIPVRVSRGRRIR